MSTRDLIYEYSISIQHNKILEDIFWIKGSEPWYSNRWRAIHALNTLRTQSSFSPVRILPKKHRNYGQHKIAYFYSSPYKSPSKR